MGKTTVMRGLVLIQFLWPQIPGSIISLCASRFTAFKASNGLAVISKSCTQTGYSSATTGKDQREVDINSFRGRSQASGVC